MNKWEREVMESLLSDEAAVLKELKRFYEEALDDIELNIKILQADEQTISRIRRVDYQKALYKQISETLDILHEGEFKTIEDFLNATYERSFVGTMYSLHGQGMPMILPIDHESAIRAVLTDSKLSVQLYDALGVDINKLKRGITAEITRGIAESMSMNEIARNIRNTTKAPLARARTIARTESHRIAETASNDAGKQAISKGADVVKQWDASLDDATRDTHRQLDGKIVEFDDYFVSGTRKALYPGQFGDPAEDCNCRCNALKRSRSKMNEDELNELKKRAEFFGLDKTEDFKDFEKKYLKASKSIENSENYGIIDTGAKGALTSKNDPDFSKRDTHAKSYYSSIRNSDQASIVNAISANVDIDKETVGVAVNHLFYTKHQLEKGFVYFDEDYDIAESIQRLRLGKGIQAHDLILIRHEALEAKYMARGMSFDEAHEKAENVYNYTVALRSYLKANGLE